MNKFICDYIIGRTHGNMKYLAERLKGNICVTSLDLTHNHIGNNADNMKYLAAGK